MERFLTKKATPHIVVRLIEVVLFLPLCVWIPATIAVAADRFSRAFSGADVFAYLLVGGVPLLIWWWIFRRWMRRHQARKVARTLAMEREARVNWQRIEEYGGIRNAQHLVEKLWEKHYLMNIECDHDGLTLTPPEAWGTEVPNGGKCRMCGAPLERRTFGDWACRHCGTVAGR